MQMPSEGLSLLERAYLVGLWLLALLALMTAMTLCANAQTPSASPASTNNKQVDWKETTRNALDKVEAQQDALKQAQALIDTQKQIIEAQQRLLDTKSQESDALRKSLDAQSQVIATQKQQLDVASKRVTDLQVKLDKAQSHHKIWAIAGFVLGVAINRVL
jgi:predicted RNase H-like nuclease (RuvC/YqgF family)